MGFQEVERPPVKTSAVVDTEALKHTVVSGKALRIPLNGEAYAKAYARWTARAKRLGVRLRTQKDGDHLLVWAEEKES